MDSFRTLIRNTEEIYAVLSFEGKIFVETHVKSALFLVVRNKQRPYEQAVFIVKPKSMFRKPKILKVCPISFELRVISEKEKIIIRWAEDKENLCEVYAPDALIKIVVEICNDYSRYQEEPFSKTSSHHKWIWYYEEFIPKIMHVPSKVPPRRHSLLFDHYGKVIMEAYINEEIRHKEEEFIENHNLELVLLSWNAGGLQPCGELDDWFCCKSRRYNENVKTPDILVVGLQEMCVLSKLLGDSSRESEWSKYVREQINRIYENKFVLMHQAALVGLLNLVFVRDQIAGKVSNLAFQQVKLGLKGFTGNKGALAFRFEIWDNSFCFINVHLPPHRQNFKLRNENLMFINRTLKFAVGDSFLSLTEHSHVFWLGDFNYRINELNTDQIVKLLANNDIQNLLSFDQLAISRKSHSILPDYQEPEILFNPTFKYRMGSNQHNLKRDPAWCDRILFRGSATASRYDCCDSILYSDHKPIFGSFSLVLKKSNHTKLNQIITDIRKDIKEKHLIALPKLWISHPSINFGTLSYKALSSCKFEVKNTGNSTISIEFFSETWAKVQPRHTELAIDENIEITVIVMPDINLIRNYRDNLLNRNLKLVVNKNISQHFIYLEFSMADTFIGYSCEQLWKAAPSKVLEFVPEPLEKLVNFIKSKEFDVRDIAKVKYSATNIGKIVKVLDDGGDLDTNFCPFEVIFVICDFLKGLKEPLLDVKLVDSKFRLINFIGLDVIKHQVLNEMKIENRSCLLLIIEYLQRIVPNKPNSEVNSKYLAVKIYKAIYQVDSFPEQMKHHMVLFLQSFFD